MSEEVEQAELEEFDDAIERDPLSPVASPAQPTDWSALQRVFGIPGEGRE